MIRKTDSPASRLFWFLASLKLAVIDLLGLAFSLAAGTIIESVHDTPSAQYWVYRSPWFKLLLVMLGVNILAVALSRWPWKKKHTAFLMAHAGILILLFGSWLTDRFGLDGMLRVTEGETSGAVEFDTPILVVSDPSQGMHSVRSVPVDWLPPGVAFKPFTLASKGVAYDVRVDDFISHAEPEFKFLPRPATAGAKESKPTPAVRIKISGGPMRISQDFWLWTGQPGWNAFQAGPAWFSFGSEPIPPAETPESILFSGGKVPQLHLTPSPDGGLGYKSISSSGEKAQGRLAPGKISGQEIPANWKGGVKLSILDYIPDARIETKYKPARVQYKDQAPPSAIHLSTGKGGEGSEIWLGLGERALLHVEGRQIELGYFRKRVILPFALRLERFTIERYEGTMSPKSYESKVTVVDPQNEKVSGNPVTISMNEPLEHRGVTLYQASYEDAMPRPVTSIFSVNQDPGRIWKYLGSLLIVLGAILLFASKYRRKAVPAEAK